MAKTMKSRREFLKICTVAAGALGLGPAFIPKIAEALTSDSRPPTVWLHFSECTGCSEAFLRAFDPNVVDILFDVLNITYHETIMAASGDKAHHNLEDTLLHHTGEFICICEGSIPTANNGVYGMINGKTMLSIAETVVPKAKYTIAFGTCAAFGGLPAANGGLTGAQGVGAALNRTDIVNLTGCPPHPMNLVSCITNYLLFNQMPTLMSDGRPEFCHGNSVHKLCTKPFGCLSKDGCQGSKAYNNCPSQLYNEENFCVGAEHHCIGCAEDGFWDDNAPFYNKIW
jgi:[NiFe] hydrogenase small subunit